MTTKKWRQEAADAMRSYSTLAPASGGSRKFVAPGTGVKISNLSFPLDHQTQLTVDKLRSRIREELMGAAGSKVTE